MLLAIDVGNTHTVYGAWTNEKWEFIWRRRTDANDTEDELVAWLRSLYELAGLPWEIDRVVCASVVPAANDVLERLATRRLKAPIRFLRTGAQVGIAVDYEPADAVGADRIANVMAALRTFRPPLIIVDFGTATTFDAVDSFGRYLGGAILPGVGVSSEALFARAARLPHVDQLSLTPPEAAIGRTTVGALRSGIVFGYAGAVDALVGRIGRELGGTPKVIATGGLGSMFLGVCESLSEYVPNLTLDGLRLAWDKLAGSSD